MPNSMDLINKYLGKVKEAYTKFNVDKHLFFRGHSNKDFVLQPSVLRKREYDEKEIFLDFKQYAPAHAIGYDFTSQKDKLLVDMQHYGIPTRLLDWTVAPLNALFFACLEPEDKDGEVIVLDPWHYWLKIVRDRDHPEIHQIHITARSLLASGWKMKYIQGYINKHFDYAGLEEEDIFYPFPFVATFTNQRIIHQRGCFTIHGIQVAGIEAFPIVQDYLMRIPVVASDKATILQELNLLYVNHYSIYPDFEGMQKVINKNYGLFNVSIPASP